MAVVGLRCQVILFTLLFMASVAYGAKLSKSHYYRTCPKLETVVRNKVNEIVNADLGMAPGLLRLHFHDCFVRGCDGSVLLDSSSNSAEKDAPPNAGSFGRFAEVDSIKAIVETCNDKVAQRMMEVITK